MDVIFLTFSLMKSGLRSRIFQWLSEVIKVNTSGLQHAESFETPILSPSFTCYKDLALTKSIVKALLMVLVVLVISGRVPPK